MNLHVESRGAGPELVMLHGWGMHGGMWGHVAERLAQDFRVHCVDLPGHGLSAPSSFTLDDIAEALSMCFDAPLHVCGWSLGGQVAMHWTLREPQKVKKLILVASTPCFVQTDSWDCAMDAGTLQDFFASLQENHALTLKRFLALQARGSDDERGLLATLRQQLASRPQPDMTALSGGLKILRDTDLRKHLSQIEQPTLAIAGQRDRLTPPEALHYLAQAMPHARVVEVEGAAHAPFLSHPEIFVAHLKNFLHERI